MTGIAAYITIEQTPKLICVGGTFYMPKTVLGL